MYLGKERRLSSKQGKKSNSHKRALGRAEGRYKHAGVGERRGAGKSNVRAGTAGRRRQDMERSRILEGGTICLWLLHCSLRVAQSSLPSAVNFGASVNTNQVDPTNSFKADSSPAQRLAPASLDQVFSAVCCCWADKVWGGKEGKRLVLC